jgi:hypothetical protein
LNRNFGTFFPEILSNLKKKKLRKRKREKRKNRGGGGGGGGGRVPGGEEKNLS